MPKISGSFVFFQSHWNENTLLGITKTTHSIRFLHTRFFNNFCWYWNLYVALYSKVSDIGPIIWWHLRQASKSVTGSIGGEHQSASTCRVVSKAFYQLSCHNSVTGLYVYIAVVALEGSDRAEPPINQPTIPKVFPLGDGLGQNRIVNGFCAISHGVWA